MLRQHKEATLEALKSKGLDRPDPLGRQLQLFAPNLLGCSTLYTGFADEKDD